MKQDAKTVWFVEKGEMRNSNVIGSFNLEVHIEDSAPHWSNSDLFNASIFSGCMGNSENVRLPMVEKIAERPGKWFLLSGDFKVIHSDFCYDTRKEAASAYTKYLLGDEDDGKWVNLGGTK